jgi:uncharacterized repeat protein (TIGR03803 family)
MRHTRSALVRILGNTAIALMCVVIFVAMTPTIEAQGTIYAMTGGGIYGTLNLSTGVFAQIAGDSITPNGMAGVGSNLFLTKLGSNMLYQINPLNGNLTGLGEGSILYGSFGGTTTGLYGLDVRTDDLWSVNPSTGATTWIGATGLPEDGNPQSLSSDGASLYATCNDGNLYSINTATGAATLIGPTGVVEIYSTAFFQGQLYAVNYLGATYTLNTETGAGTFVTNAQVVPYGMGLPTPTFAVLHNFTGGLDGANPWAGLTPDASGNFYGIAAGGGTGSCTFYGQSGCGTAFRLKHTNGAWTFGPLYSFEGGMDGEFPIRAVTIGSNGSVYAATAGGGEGSCTFDSESNGCGTVVNLTPLPTFAKTPLTPWLEKLLYRFAGQPDGGVATTTLIFDHNGNLYGTSDHGGTSNDGAVFELSPSGGGNYTETILYSFLGGTDGSHPLDGLISDSAGNLYGTTVYGGSTTACSGNGCGTVFELSPNGSGWTEKILYPFQGTSDGENPDSGVVMDTAGNLYGNTFQGGANGGGTVWELSPNGSSWTLTTIYTVPTAHGEAVGRVTRDSSGNLYQLLQAGGAFNDGQVFELSPSNGSWIYTDLYDFTGGTDGSEPLGSVVLDSSGNMYGTAWGGGAHPCGGGYGCGVVWELTL